MNTDSPRKKVPFEVVIPNLDGDGIAEAVPIEVEAYTDPDTGEDVLTPESLELIEKTQARRMGLMLPEEIRQLREDRLELTQDEICELLQIGAKTYTRWETGRARPSRSMNVLLCALRDGVITVEYLRTLRSGVDWEVVRSWRSGPPNTSLHAWLGNRHITAAIVTSDRRSIAWGATCWDDTPELCEELETKIAALFRSHGSATTASRAESTGLFGSRFSRPERLRAVADSLEPPSAA